MQRHLAGALRAVPCLNGPGEARVNKASSSRASAATTKTPKETIMSAVLLIGWVILIAASYKGAEFVLNKTNLL
jgi:hypothetical protein